MTCKRLETRKKILTNKKILIIQKAQSPRELWHDKKL